MSGLGFHAPCKIRLVVNNENRSLQRFNFVWVQTVILAGRLASSYDARDQLYMFRYVDANNLMSWMQLCASVLKVTSLPLAGPDTPDYDKQTVESNNIEVKRKGYMKYALCVACNCIHTVSTHIQLNIHTQTETQTCRSRKR